jgi:hypothetical protein
VKNNSSKVVFINLQLSIYVLGLILLKLCGSLIDVRFMLETVCENLDLKCVFVEEHTNPLDLLETVVDSEVI